MNNFYFDEQNYKPSRNWWKYIIVVVLCLAVGAGVAYYAINNENFGQPSSTPPVLVTPNTNIQIGNSTPIQIGKDMPLADIYDAVEPSVVSIIATVRTSATSAGTSLGTGVILSEDGYIVTNHHVIENAVKVEIHLYDGTTYTAVVVGADKVYDIAVLKIIPAGKTLVPARFGDSTATRTGEWVITVGTPYDPAFSGTMTLGIVSKASRVIKLDGTEYEYIQVDAAINPGNSGGPLLNANGQVIGINTRKIVSYNIEGMGFAIPQHVFIPIVEDIIAKGYVEPVWRLGIGIEGTVLSPDSEVLYGIPQGVYVYQYTENGPAHKAGIGKGDVIVQVEGFSPVTFDTLTELISMKKPGDTLRVKVCTYSSNYKKTVDMTITLELLEFFE
ncbi:MAG: trypsin-like serine protease [Clostridiales bacterium]|nr:trypsin-like serine protease [Clostridiales bacterium]